MIFENLRHFPMESWHNSLFGRWNTLDDILQPEGRALMLGIRHKCRAQHARRKLQLTLCDNLALTLASQKAAHYPHVSTPHVVNCVPSASSLISTSLSVGSHQSGTPRICGSRLYGPPLHVISVVTPAMLVRKSFPSSAAHGMKLCEVQTARTLRPRALALGSTKEDHCDLGTGVLTKRRLVYWCTESSSSTTDEADHGTYRAVQRNAA